MHPFENLLSFCAVSMQYTVKKNLIFARNIDRGYTLEQHQRGGSNEYNLCFGSKISKIGILLHIAVLLYMYTSVVQGGIHVTDMLS